MDSLNELMKECEVLVSTIRRRRILRGMLAGRSIV